MINNDKQKILVLNDVEATRDGYRVAAARDEREAAEKAGLSPPDLMLVSLEGEVDDVVVIAKRIRSLAGLNDDLPIIIFCVGELKESNEIAVEPNIYLAHPDNFNQLRNFISRLLDARQTAPSQSSVNELLTSPH